MALMDTQAVLAEAARLLAQVLMDEEYEEAAIAEVLGAALVYLDPRDTEARKAVQAALDVYETQAACTTEVLLNQAVTRGDMPEYDRLARAVGIEGDEEG